jgi:UDP-N-acetylmuramyl pentapeptide phosphotransferase/UDP-N-acetylglucosamine-1-phosphate transferase
MSGEFTDLFAVAACGAVVAVAEAVTIPLLRRAAIIDVPGHRSSYTVPTPGGGGIPIAAGLLVAAVLIGDANAAVFAFAVVAFGLLGFADDLRGLTRGWRLIVQAVGGTIADTTWALLRRIRTLAADPERRQAMGRQGRSYVEKHFDCGELARVDRKLLDAPGGRR